MFLSSILPKTLLLQLSERYHITGKAFAKGYILNTHNAFAIWALDVYVDVSVSLDWDFRVSGIEEVAGRYRSEIEESGDLVEDINYGPGV
jgi:hypothetical protein